LAVFAAIAALIGGLTLSYIRVPKTLAPSAQTRKAPAQQQTNQVQQTSSGPGSPNVQGVQGNITITVDQSTGQTNPPKSAEKKTEQKK
jgi:hypothetical protein